LAELPRLGNIAEVHRGIKYNIPFEENKAKLVSDVPLDGFVRGLTRIADDFEPFAIKGFKYLNVSSEKQLYEAYLLPWNFPKVIVNAVGQGEACPNPVPHPLCHEALEGRGTFVRRSHLRKARVCPYPTYLVTGE
jgi:hypothetical protein